MSDARRRPEKGEIYRFPVRGIVALGVLWGILYGSLVFDLVVTTIQYLTTDDTSVILPGMVAIFLVIWTTFALVWLRNRPTLELGADGLFVSKVGSRKLFLTWSDIQSIDDVRRRNVQTDRLFRLFEIHWVGGVIKFDEFYTRLPNLLMRLNAEIQKHGIKVVVHDYDRNAIRMAGLNATPSEWKRLRRCGVTRIVSVLELPG
jgi:hypothetical protein